MIALACPKCGARMRVDDARAGGSSRCPACGASVTVPARGVAPPEGSEEFVWNDEVGPPPVRRREIPPPPVIDVVDADELARAEARMQPKSPRSTEPRLDSAHEGQSHYTDAELGVTKPVSPLRPARRGRPQRQHAAPELPATGVSVGQVLLGCLASSIGFLILIGAIVIAILNMPESTPKLIVWIVVLLTGIFLFLGGVIVTIFKGMMGR